MNHPSEDRLVLFHYEGDRAVARHVASCPVCRGRLGALRGLLEVVERAPVPEREESYGRQVWSRVAPRLRPRPSPAWGRLFSPLRLALAAGLAALVAAAFLAGRFAGLGERPAPSPGEVRERVLVVALGEHLERSQAVLLEFVHAAAGGDASGERARAQELVGANRLYRQAASFAGDRAASNVLDDLERVLLEVAHGPSVPATSEAAASSTKEVAEDVLFEVKVLRSRMQERESRKAALPSIERKRT